MSRKPLAKKLLALCIVIVIYLILSIFSPGHAVASDHPILYFFWGDGCPHCEKEKKFLEKLQAKYPELEMRWFETWNHPEFAKLADAMRQAYEVKESSVPTTFLGRWTLPGYRSDEETGILIEEQVIACIQYECIDALEMVGPRRIALRIREEATENTPIDWKRYPAMALLRTQEKTPRPLSNPNPPSETMIKLPIIGLIDAAKMTLPLSTIIIAGLDGFNPCAMWVLCFLLTLVIYAKSRAKILLIGGIFVITSGVIYLTFMIIWFNLFALAGPIKFLRITVAIVAIVMGIINCKDFFFFKKGISLTIPESAQPKLFKRMRTIIHTAAIPGMILGTIVLAVTANFIELLCTAGFPMLYANILTIQNLSKLQYYFYLVFYNVVYVIPLAAIVGVFVWKMGGRKLTEKEGRIMKLVGGVLMLALGIILLVKPQLLMFG